MSVRLIPVQAVVYQLWDRQWHQRVAERSWTSYEDAEAFRRGLSTPQRYEVVTDHTTRLVELHSSGH